MAALTLRNEGSVGYIWSDIGIGAKQGLYLKPFFYSGHFDLENCTFTVGHDGRMKDSKTRKAPTFQGKRVSILS